MTPLISRTLFSVWLFFISIFLSIQFKIYSSCTVHGIIQVIENRFINQPQWVDNPSNWPICVDYVKEIIDKKRWRPEELSYPKKNQNKVRGCIVALVGSKKEYQ